MYIYVYIHIYLFILYIFKAIYNFKLPINKIFDNTVNVQYIYHRISTKLTTNNTTKSW
jgi:hypothetical protein